MMNDKTLYVCGKVEDVIKTDETLKHYYEKTRLIIIDPPRE
jgi:tRNA/tmRNA/rRNA uracil-C5-methylase (TrmA/RlmC/RlmD family)